MKENEKLREEIFYNLLKVFKLIINAVMVGAVIASIVICMMNLLPAVTDGSAKVFNKAIKKCIWTVIVMLLIILIPGFLNTIGNLFNFDTSCIP